MVSDVEVFFELSGQSKPASSGTLMCLKAYVYKLLQTKICKIVHHIKNVCKTLDAWNNQAAYEAGRWSIFIIVNSSIGFLTTIS